MGVLTWALVTVLGVIGFAATGPVAGSLAAGIQSVVYGGAVGAGSMFAWAQSVAMASPTPWLFIWWESGGPSSLKKGAVFIFYLTNFFFYSTLFLYSRDNT